jgi:serine/threonine protein kinase
MLVAHIVYQDQHVDLGDTCTLGRQRCNDVAVLDPKASREHCRIEQRGQQFVLVDLGSANGTQLNGERIQGEQPLQHADRIGIGRVQISFFSTDPDIVSRIETTGWNQDALRGRLLGPNRLQRLLAQGTISSIYQACQLDLDRTVAIRIFHPELIASGVLSGDDIAATTRTAGKVVDPGIAAIHEYGEADQLLWYSMEFVEGETLASLLMREGRFSLPAALALVQRLARSLGKAHDQGVCHHGLSPETIMITRDGRVKILELGIAPLLHRQKHLLRLHGNRHYLAPEQLRGEATGPAVDAYALGCVLFHLLTGRPPFDGQDDVAKAHLTRPPPRLRLFAKELPPMVDDFLGKLLGKDPEQRFSSMSQLSRDLRYLRHGDRASRESTEISIQIETLPVPTVSHRRLIIACTVLLILAALVAVWWVWQHPESLDV